MLKLGIDAGNYKGKTVGIYGVDTFRTNVCEWFVQDVKEVFGEDDMEFEIDGRRGFAGSIAKYEDEFGGSMYGDTKAHEDTKVRVLLAIYRYLQMYCPNETYLSIVVGQPFGKHNDGEKNAIKKMLQGYHEYTVNGQYLEINIDRVEVAAEGGGAYWCSPVNGLVRIIDIGSGTVNAVSVFNKKILNNASGTFNFGMETVVNKENLTGLARGIIRNTTILKWNKDDVVYLCGGVAEQIEELIASHYKNVVVIHPELTLYGDDISLLPVYSNAVGFHEIAKIVYK